MGQTESKRLQYSGDVGDCTAISANLTSILPAWNTRNYTAYILDRSVKQTFINQRQTLCYLEIWILEPRLHIPIGYSNLILPEAAWSYGLTLNSATNSVSSTLSQPTDSQIFTQYWRIIKHKKICLKPGIPHTEISRSKKPFKFTTAIELPNIYLAGCSRSIMSSVYGIPDNDKTTTTNVGISPTAVDVITEQYMKIKVNNNNIATYVYTDTLPTTYPAGESAINWQTLAVQQPPVGA